LWTDPQTGRTFYLDQQTSELVYSDGSRVPASSRFPQPAPNVPRTSTGAVRQLSANAFSPQPYNQQYTSSPPVATGPSVQNVARHLQNVSIAKPAVPTTSISPYAVGGPIDGAEVVRNPPIRGAPPRRFSFSPEFQSRLLDPGVFSTAAGGRLLVNDVRLQGPRSAREVLRSRQGMCLQVTSMDSH